MKNRVFKAIVSGVLAAAMIVPMAMTAGAATPAAKAVQKAAEKAKATIQEDTPQLNAVRSEIASLNSDILQLKQQDRTLLQQLVNDIAGIRGTGSLTSTQEFQDLVNGLKQIRTDATKAETYNYKQALKDANSYEGTTRSKQLSDVINLLLQKKALLQQVQTELQAACKKADALVAQKQTAVAAWNSFHTQAVAKKKTIDQQNEQILKGLADCRNILSKIVATASTNKAVLESKQSDLQKLNAQLQTVTLTLNIYDGSIAAAAKTFQSDKQSRNYTDALAQLDKIISIQKQRLAVITTAQGQLQSVLDALNALVSSSGAPASSPAASAA